METVKVPFIIEMPVGECCVTPVKTEENYTSRYCLFIDELISGGKLGCSCNLFKPDEHLEGIEIITGDGEKHNWPKKCKKCREYMLKYKINLKKE